MIHYFGDSNTAGIGNDNAPKGIDYFHISYATYLTKLLGIAETNYSYPGKNFMLNLRDLSSNLSKFEKRDIVVFQTQFFCNSLLQYPNKDFVVSSGIFGSDKIYTNSELDISEDDSLTLLKWTTRFEERRSLYDLDILIEILRYLRTKGVETYLLYWLRGFDVELPDNELLLKFDNNPYVCDSVDIPTINKETNGKWKDEHTSNKFNEELANKIYNKIFG